MYRIRTYNKIAEQGLERFNKKSYMVSDTEENPDALIVRSAAITPDIIPASVRAIARAGVGINNIPIEYCTKKGIAVFNTPGANANSVKELVIAALLMAARKIFQSMLWTQSLSGKGDEITALIEKNKKVFAGPELYGKTLGVIGLGAVGVTIANAAIDLGMKVIGYDPYLSIQSAWKLNQAVVHVQKIESILAKSDYITIHIPFTADTQNLINTTTLEKIKAGASILNFSRSGLINNQDIITALKTGKLANYITDFPEDELINKEGVLCIPHLGASTPEAEENCAIMAVDSLTAYLEQGIITNSVNLPTCILDLSYVHRLCILHKNVPNMVGQITSALAQDNLNIANMLNKHKNDIACTIIDVDIDVKAVIAQETLRTLQSLEGVIRTQYLQKNTS